MIRRTLLIGLAASSFVVLSPVAMAEPTAPQVIQSIQSGQYAQAQQQLSEVLAAHPKSAQAQYLESRLLAKEGKWQEASTALQRAKSLDPSLSFVQPKVLAGFEKQLQQKVGKAAPAAAASEKSHSRLGAAIAWFLGLIAVIAGISWFLRRRRQQQAMAYRQMQPGFGNMGGFPGQGGAYGPQGPYGPAGSPQGGGIGSGLASGIATGVGIGAGMAAGNAIAGSLFGHHDDQNGSNDAGQNDQFGMTDTSWGGDDSSAGDFGMGGDDDSWV
ncbi:tetratricopeptide repeat protein [Acidithiobacillus sp. CV18-2]|uniref:Tetratricopeptide repeat protein n=1 Tax=Igneacidithiobacillus copahuensis TaxID=2724909 RepID=A0AAE3CJC8_9PROT|nr:tetratricopeptide repeat protein [Igneacidithiobacillus copahuensis]MBU2755279.1 tetratricopeptide repeat protein [Acidithiobacillus sp. CV18-3]MBU2758365.1 tetratricopeptide repeat protein [Acidithiobacillus sp. BN09-2]MBU2778210.1 tetratricopeptide repeat protein [Acidithiobacillus sp. CV18-2]MBU2796934.1 tetratricopeptide repeat protein [Acidithiobacillus sp. VAN18-2]MBU2799083.1 tetratricopeptide repeat protein [Acidithiobacillus sp. VAN18-4]UTV79952.1 tetratricopeptide repeat protein 